MAYLDMTQELTGALPKLPYPYARTLINRAWRDVCRRNLWSFQLYESNWTTPNIVNAGAASVTIGSNQVVLNAQASAAVNAIGTYPSPVTARQFRVGISTIYNIWAATTGPSVTLTLDRPYTDATAAAAGYQISQCYYAAPFQDHRSWVNIRDILNFNNLNLTLSRKELDFRDPQRSLWWIPTNCVYYQNDQNPVSPTFGFPLYELWGPPQYELVYQTYGIRKGALLQKDTDTLPPAVGEDCVLALARSYAYEWAEANKGDQPRQATSDYRFLIGMAQAEYKRLAADYRKDDRELVDNWFEIRRPRMPFPSIEGFYNAISNTAWPGIPW